LRGNKETCESGDFDGECCEADGKRHRLDECDFFEGKAGKKRSGQISRRATNDDVTQMGIRGVECQVFCKMLSQCLFMVVEGIPVTNLALFCQSHPPYPHRCLSNRSSISVRRSPSRMLAVVPSFAPCRVVPDSWPFPRGWRTRAQQYPGNQHHRTVGADILVFG